MRAVTLRTLGGRDVLCVPLLAGAPILLVADQVFDGGGSALGELFEVAHIKPLRAVVGHGMSFELRREAHRASPRAPPLQQPRSSSAPSAAWSARILGRSAPGS